MEGVKKCTNEEALEIKNKYNLKLNWDTDFAYKIIKDKKTIALIEISTLEDDYFIYNFEVIEKNKGIGSYIINDLKTQGNRIKLYSIDENSKRFWENMGFEAEEESEDTYVHVYYPDNR